MDSSSAALPVSARAGRNPATEVRKTVTVVFCDVTGSTSLGERLDPESLRRVMSRYFEEMKVVIERHGGTVEKFIGDAVMAVFGIPSRARGRRAPRGPRRRRDARGPRDPEQGARTRPRRHDRLEDRGQHRARSSPATRMPGQTLVTGDAVNVAARLEQAAAPGEILIGETHAAARPGRRRGGARSSSTLKGKAEPVAAYRLEHVAPGAAGVVRHLDVPMVGRERELRLIRDAFDAAVGERALPARDVARDRRRRQVAAHRGVRRRAEGDALVLRGQCLSYGDGITYWPIVEMLTSVAGIADDDDPTQVRAKIGGALRLDPRSGDRRRSGSPSSLGSPAPPPPPRRPTGRSGSSSRPSAARRPVVAVFEDIHWAEPALPRPDRARRRAVDGRTDPAPLHRSAGVPGRACRHGESRSRSTTILLEPLGREESGEMIAEPPRAGRTARRTRPSGSPRPPRATRCSSSRWSRC